jgi:hypothetical protein
MPSNDRIYGKVPTHVNKDKAYGVNKDPGPYIALVKNNVDPTRAGRLRVFVPDFGGSETQESQWVTVSYASPFMGATRWPRAKQEKSEKNTYEQVNHAYGMWFTPPDVGNSVMVFFVGGDINRGYWFACVMPELTHYEIPGLAGSKFDTRETTLHPDLIDWLPTPPYPVTEFNEVNKSLWGQWSEFLTIKKPLHEDQCIRLLKEGLEDDKIRGVITSSGQRESPSRVFGISTPGPEAPDPRMPDLNKVDGPRYRLGGHTFVMDDGDEKGDNRQIRIRTHLGHHIMLNDTHGFVYVSNAEGTAWFEMTKEGKFHFYGKDSISFRTEKDFNVHADRDINFHAQAEINAYAVTNIVQETPGQITLRADAELNMFGGAVGLKSGSKIGIQSDSFTNIKVGTFLKVSAGGNLTLKTAADLNTQSGGTTTHLAGGDIIETAPQIHMNGPTAPAAPEAKAFEKPAPLDRGFHYDPTPEGPYEKMKPMSKKFVSINPIVPTHEPFGDPAAAPKRSTCSDDGNNAGTVPEGHTRPHALPTMHDNSVISKLGSL